MKRKVGDAEVRVVVEVDGQPVGYMSLDMERLWPLINHRIKETPPAEWIDRRRFQTMVRAIVMKSLSHRLQFHLYASLGNEMVKAELYIEGLKMKAEEVAQTFGRARSDIEKLVAKSGKTSADFYEFFWNYMMDDRDGIDPKKAWKAATGRGKSA
jgi:hypothetical protein